MNFKDKFSYASRIIKKSGPPIQLTFFLTSRCNLRCEHCFYWKELDSDHSHELSLDEIKNIAKSLPRLLVLSITGGEPFVRKDISDVVKTFTQETRVHIVTISTNGFYIKRMQEYIPKMLTENPNTNILFYVSIDGPEKIHDKIRGAGSYKKAMETIKVLQPFRKKFKNMGISVSMTCTQTNQDFISDEFKFINNSGLTDNVNIGFVRGDVKKPEIKEVALEKYKELTKLKLQAEKEKKLKYPDNIMFNSFVNLKNEYTYKAVEHVYEHDSFILPCQSGNLMGILYDDGVVRPCEILENSDFGNIRNYNYDFIKLWNDLPANKIRKKIKNGCYCTFECSMSSSILFNPKYLSKIAVKAAAQKLKLV